LAGMLMSKDPHEVAAVVKLLEDRAAAQGAKNFRAGAQEMGAVTGTTAALPGSPVEKAAPRPETDIDTELSAPSPRKFNIEDELK